MSTTESAVPILFVHFGNDWIRGSEQCLLDLVAHIDRARFDPVVVCNHDILANAIRAVGGRASVMREAAPSDVVAPRWQVRGLRRAAEGFGARLVHVNTSVCMPALVPVARGLRLPLVAHLHITPTASERRHELLHQASLVVGVSRLTLEGFAEEGMKPERLQVINNAVDGARVSAGDARGLREALGIGRAACVAATLGSLIERKAHDVAIDAVARARARGSDVHLLVCGSGEEEGSLRTLAARLGVGESVHFLGFRTDAGAILRDATNVCLAPSRWEALPLNVLEAQWLGVPVIASDIPAHEEALVSRASSVLVKVDDAAGLADALVAFTHDAERPRLALEVTRPQAQERFSMRRYITDFEQAYAALLARPAGGYGWLRASSWPGVYTTWTGEIVSKRLKRLVGVAGRPGPAS